jgi:hypothetical protein
MVRHNNVIPNQHFHKDWQTRVKTWFDQVRGPLMRYFTSRGHFDGRVRTLMPLGIRQKLHAFRFSFSHHTCSSDVMPAARPPQSAAWPQEGPPVGAESQGG